MSISCACGFECGSQGALNKHLKKFGLEDGTHYQLRHRDAPFSESEEQEQSKGIVAPTSATLNTSTPSVPPVTVISEFDTSSHALATETDVTAAEVDVPADATLTDAQLAEAAALAELHAALAAGNVEAPVRVEEDGNEPSGMSNSEMHCACGYSCAGKRAFAKHMARFSEPEASEHFGLRADDPPECPEPPGVDCPAPPGGDEDEEGSFKCACGYSCGSKRAFNKHNLKCRESEVSDRVVLPVDSTVLRVLSTFFEPVRAEPSGADEDDEKAVASSVEMHCACGYSCGSKKAFKKHMSNYSEAESSEHYVLEPEALAVETVEGAETAGDAAARDEDGSLTRELHCACGYNCGSKKAYNKHTSRFTEPEASKHFLVAAAQAAAAVAEAAEALSRSVEPGMTSQAAKPTSALIEDFIARNTVNDEAASALRSAPVSSQEAVLSKGDIRSHDPSTQLMSLLKTLNGLSLSEQFIDFWTKLTC